jgi:hypothetical protein
VSGAPLFNNALRGEASSGFFRALSEADNFVKELDRVHELETRIQELEGTPSLPERMRLAAETIAEVSALYGYKEPEFAEWTANDLRGEAKTLEQP